MAVVLIIIGVIISVIATAIPSLLKSAKIRQAQGAMDRYEFTLEGYIGANGRCPCPDTNSDGVEDRNDNGTPDDAGDDTCAAYVGTLPYFTLGLSSGEDPWGNLIRYAVYEDFIRTSTSTLCTSLSGFIQAAFDAGKVHTTHSTGDNPTNQAYVIVSGGSKDLDGRYGFFDAANGTPAIDFDIPDRIITTEYDDVVRAVSFTYLHGKLCSGGGGGGGGGGEGEAENCTNGTDDDGDGYVDCADQDCFGQEGCGSGGDDVSIVTSSIPSGNVNTSYLATFQGTGGATPYEWLLPDNGGLADLYLHPYTGQMAGPLDKCPGTYTIQVKLTDATPSGEDGPKTQDRSFSLEITSNLVVSGPVDVTFDSPTHSEEYTVSDSLLGSLSCEVVPSDDFYAAAQGGNKCVLRKKSATAAGTYLLTMKATDGACPDNTATLTNITATVTASGAGPSYSEALEAEWHFDECTTWTEAAQEVVETIDVDGDHLLYGQTVGDTRPIGSGRLCRAAYFDGSGDYITVDGDNDKMRQTGDLTLAFWIRTSTTHSDWVRLVGKGNSTNRNYGLWLARDGTILFQIYSDGGYGNARTSTTINDGVWHHVAGVYDKTNSTMTVFIDNTQAAQITFNQTPRVSADPFTMGYAGFHTYFNGSLDEVVLLHSALTTAQVDEMYQLTRPTCSGDCYTGALAEYKMENSTWNGTADEVRDTGTGASHGFAAQWGSGVLATPTAEGEGKSCRAGRFTKVDDNNGGYLDLGDPIDGDLDPGSSPWTITAWVQWDGSAGYNIIYNKENLYEAQVRNGYLQYAWQPHWAWDGGTSFPVTANTWCHMVTLYDGTRQIVFKDGVQVYNREQTGVIGSNSNKFLIGARGNTSPRHFFGGKIDELRIYDRALSDSEIKAIFDGPNPCE